MTGESLRDGLDPAFPASPAKTNALKSRLLFVRHRRSFLTAKKVDLFSAVYIFFKPRHVLKNTRSTKRENSKPKETTLNVRAYRDDVKK